MHDINLLPWRAEARARKNKQFGIASIVAIVAAAVLAFFFMQAVQVVINAQEDRNKRIQVEIAKADKTLKEIKNLKTLQNLWLERRKVINKLQADRPVIVQILNDFVNTMPNDGLFYNSIEQDADTFTLKGISESNARISALMRSIETTKWLLEPQLVEIKDRRQGKDEDLGDISDFSLKVKRRPPLAEEKEKQEAKKKKKTRRKRRR